MAQLRAASLDDIFVIRDYRAEKNSFVESPERKAGSWTGPGYRQTLLEAVGTGSVRHIWTTRGGGEPYFDWEFYIDGEATPSIRGTDEALVRAAEAYALPVAAANSVPLNNRDFNFFLPIPFSQSIRIDAVQRVPPFWLWFCQIDYRLEDDSLKGARLFSRGDGENLALFYAGLPHQQKQAPSSPLPPAIDRYASVPLRPGEMLAFHQLDGPAIIRELKIKRPKNANLRLLVRYDGEKTFAVDAPLDKFFGPFEGASLATKAAESTCYLPMPFRQNCDVLLVNQGSETVHLSGQASIEPLPSFDQNWGYFHALHQKTGQSNGHRPHQVLYTRGAGHWLGMALYNTGHDHGGGDFAVIDGESAAPSFLHGVNGEDYFTFAWFGKGAHHPYAVAHANEAGRYRHHFENPYPFKQSIAIEWGAFAGLSPESVAYWYQDTPANMTLADGAKAISHEWDVFGPVPIPYDEDGNSIGGLYEHLPSTQDLDEGKQFKCALIDESFTSGWMKEWSVGPSLNLTYIGRHGTGIEYEAELGGMGHAYLARRFVEADSERWADIQFANDDPAEVWVNGTLARSMQGNANGFQASQFPIHLKPGKNEVVVKLANYFNRNFNWAGFWLRGLE